MRALMRFAASALFAFLGAGQSHAASLTCTGKFPNPISDICWSCVLPITIGNAAVASMGQEDFSDGSIAPICSCGLRQIIGVSIGFWEPARVVEVVRKPFCLVSMGGLDLSPGIAAPEHGRFTRPEASGVGAVFYQAHYYTNPILAWLEVLGDYTSCLEQGSFDLAYLTEVDPLWNDDELTLILNPDAVLFANPVAVAACAADCVAATAGFGIRQLFWCAGCQGGIYPLDGRIAYDMGGVRDAELITERLTYKMHRQLIANGYHGAQALCGPYVLPTMDKRAYKTELLYPTPETRKDGSGRCCQPFGRTTILWGAGKEYPVSGEDFSFQLFRKRNCCEGYGS